jgi:hypothetical protein
MKTLSQTKTALGHSRLALNVLRLASNVADGETITIGNETYEIDTAAAPGAVTAGNIRVDCSAGVTPTQASAALVAAVNANSRQGLQAEAISVNEVAIWGPTGNLDCSETLAGSNNAWHNTATFFGSSSAQVRARDQAARAAVAKEVTLGNMHFLFPFRPASVLVQVRTAAGVAKAWDGVITLSNYRVTLDNSGSTDFAATDIVTVSASE